MSRNLLTYTLNFSISVLIKESCFPDCWKVSSVVHMFKNIGEKSTAKNCCPVSLLSVVSKVFGKLVNIRIVDHLEKCGFFLDSQHSFRTSWSTADLLAAVSCRIARDFNRFGATRAVALDIFNAFDRVWRTGLPHKLNKFYGISGQIFGLTSSFLANRWIRVVLDEKSSQEYPVNAGVPQGFILGPTLFLRCINAHWGSFSKITPKKSTCTVMVRITITFANQIFL